MRNVPVVLPVLFAAAWLAACGGEPTPPPPGPAGCGAGQPVSTAGRALTGTALYERIPATPGGLDHAHPVRLPIRGARVVAMSGAAVLATSTSDLAGHFSLSWTGPAVVTVKVVAQSPSPPIRVEDPGSGGALHALEACVDSGAASPLELVATSGWGGSGYTAPRLSGPFAILDTLLAASQVFLAERPVDFAPLAVSWSPSVTSAHYDRDQRRLYLAGVADENTDEFDPAVIVHEWGHHFIHTLSRSDDVHAVPIGGHGFGAVQDPRLSWNEGWATAVVGLVFSGGDFLDTYGPGQQQAVRFHAEDDDNGPYDQCPGWVSENGVVHVLADLFDAASAAEPFDTVTLSAGEVYDLMVGPQRETEAFTTIFSFLAAVKASHPGSDAQVDAIAAHYGVHGTDAWGAGETNDAPGTCLADGTPGSPGVPGLLPVYHWLELGGPAVALMLEFDRDRYLSVPSRFAAFVGSGAPVTLTADGAGQALLLEVFENGAPRARGERQGDGTYLTGAVATQAGKRYTVTVSGPASGSYSWPVTLRAMD